MHPCMSDTCKAILIQLLDLTWRKLLHDQTKVFTVDLSSVLPNRMLRLSPNWPGVSFQPSVLNILKTQLVLGSDTEVSLSYVTSSFISSSWSFSLGHLLYSEGTHQHVQLLWTVHLGPSVYPKYWVSVLLQQISFLELPYHKWLLL